MDPNQSQAPEPQSSFNPSVLIIIGVALIAAILAGVFLT